jgi:pilus assembly protein CpaE
MDQMTSVYLVACTSSECFGVHDTLAECGLQIEAEFEDVRGAIDGIRLSQNEKRLCVAYVGSVEEAQQLRWLSESFIGRPLMALVDRDCSSELIFAVNRAGAVQVLPVPLQPADLLASLNILHKRYAVAEAVSARRIIAVSGVTGGCGATTIAMNLSYEISHLLELTCILVELSNHMGMLATFLDIEPRYTTYDLFCDISSVNREFLDKALTRVTDKFRVLAAPYQDTARLDVPPTDILALLQLVKQLSDVVVLDVPGNVYDAHVQTYAACDQLVLVAEQSVPSLRALSYMRERLEQDGISKPQTLVINRYNPLRKEFMVTHLQRLLQTPQLVTIANDYATVSTALNEGHPLREHAPKSPVLSDIDNLARLLINPGRPETKPAVAPQKRHYLRRLVRALVGL